MKFTTKGDHYHAELSDASQFDRDTFITKELTKDKNKPMVKAVMAKKKNGNSMEIQHYLFPKKEWTYNEAKAWAEKNMKKSIKANLLARLYNIYTEYETIADYRNHPELTAKYHGNTPHEVVEQEMNLKEREDSLLICDKCQHMYQQYGKVCANKYLKEATCPKCGAMMMTKAEWNRTHKRKFKRIMSNVKRLLDLNMEG